MNARLAFQIAGNHPGQRLTHNQSDRLVMMALEQRPKRRLDPPHRALDRLALRRTDRLRVVDPLPEKLGIPALDLVDLEPLPESLVEVAEFVDSFGTDRQGLADDFRGSNHILARTTVQGRERRAVQALCQRLGHPCHFALAALAERDVEDSLHAILLVVNRRAGLGSEPLGTFFRSNKITGLMIADHVE